jgi:hypothetical protein
LAFIILSTGIALGNLIGGIGSSTGSPAVQVIGGLIMIGSPLVAFCLMVFGDHKDENSSNPPGFCRACGYNLTGNVSGRCPECGTPIKGTHSDPPGTRPLSAHGSEGGRRRAYDPSVSPTGD